MKKIKIISIILFMIVLTGCTASNKAEVITHEKDEYLSYIKELKSVKETSKEETPFDIDVKYDKLTEDEVRFQVIIDNPKGEIKNISAIAVHDQPTDDVFPNTGIFEKKENLVPNKKPSGIILVGYIPYEGNISKFKCNIKVLINYTYKDRKYKVYYVTKKD